MVGIANAMEIRPKVERINGTRRRCLLEEHVDFFERKIVFYVLRVPFPRLGVPFPRLSGQEGKVIEEFDYLTLFKVC